MLAGALLGAPAQAADIAQVAMSDPQFSPLVRAVKAAGLADALKGDGPLTVFAPTNAAFAKMPRAKLNALLANKAQLQAVLKYHVIAGKKLMAADVMGMTGPADVPTLQGTTVHVLPSARVNNARIVKTDVEADNGVLHAIDTVLMPKPAGRMARPMMKGKMSGAKKM